MSRRRRDDDDEELPLRASRRRRDEEEQLQQLGLASLPADVLAQGIGSQLDVPSRLAATSRAMASAMRSMRYTAQRCCQAPITADELRAYVTERMIEPELAGRGSPSLWWVRTIDADHGIVAAGYLSITAREPSDDAGPLPAGEGGAVEVSTRPGVAGTNDQVDTIIDRGDARYDQFVVTRQIHEWIAARQLLQAPRTVDVNERVGANLTSPEYDVWYDVECYAWVMRRRAQVLAQCRDSLSADTVIRRCVWLYALDAIEYVSGARGNAADRDAFVERTARQLRLMI